MHVQGWSRAEGELALLVWPCWIMRQDKDVAWLDLLVVTTLIAGECFF
jgi:hypothetical protein